jgi:hypothetical protein
MEGTVITINYECQPSGQKMKIKLTQLSDSEVETNISFLPDASDNTQDPYGIMWKLIDSVMPKGDEE